MNIVWDPIWTINLILCIIILIFGILARKKAKSPFPLYIGLAFGLFGLSHLANILGLKTSLSTVMIVVRILAYLLVTFAVYKMAFGKK
jgi:hypothetical protein